MTRPVPRLQDLAPHVAPFAPAIAVLVVQPLLYPMDRGNYALAVVTGLLTALVAVGLALVYRANRIINFAQGDLGTVPTVLAVGIITVNGLPWFVGVAAGLAASVVLGAVAELAIVRRFWKSPRLLLTVATIGLSQLLIVVGALLPRWWGRDLFADKRLPQPFGATVEIGQQTFRGSEILAAILAPLLLVGLAVVLRRTDLGVAVRASAERADRAALLGVPVRRLQTLVWAVAGLLSFVGVFLHASIFGIGAAGTTSVQAMLFALGALVLGRLEHLPAVAASAVALRVLGQGAVVNNPATPGRVYVVLGVVILVVLLLRRSSGRRADQDSTSSWQNLGELRPVPAELRDLPVVRALGVVLPVLLVAAAAALPLVLSVSNTMLASQVAIFALVALSITVLTGWAGQVSLGQMSFVAVGGAVGAVATVTWDLDLLLALLIAGVAGAVVAVVVGLPALRLPGLYLAVTTLAFALASSNFLLNRRSQSWIPRESFDRPPLLHRFSLDSQAAMYELVLAVVVLCFLAVVGIRRSRTGRVLMAARDNDRAARAFSVSVLRAKLTGFAVSGFLAAVAGCLLVHVNRAYTEVPFTAQESLTVFTTAVVGGLGSWIGPVLGALYLQGGDHFLPERWQLLPTAIGVLAVLLALPGGLADLVYRLRDGFLRRLARRRGIVVPSLLADEGDEQLAPALRAPGFDVGAAPDPERLGIEEVS